MCVCLLCYVMSSNDSLVLVAIVTELVATVHCMRISYSTYRYLTCHSFFVSSDFDWTSHVSNQVCRINCGLQ